MQILLDAETTQKNGSIALCIPSVEFCKFFLQFSCTDSVFICKILFHVKSILLLHDVPKHRVSHHHGVNDRAIIEFEVVLRKNRQTLTWT